MEWQTDCIELAHWAMKNQDLQQRFIRAKTAAEVNTAVGIDRCLETTIVLAIFEAALAKGYEEGVTLGYEKRYPKGPYSKKKNFKRCDLAFKDEGRGTKWGFVEVKKYTGTGRAALQSDVNKLLKIKIKCQRLILTYRVRKMVEKAPKLEALVLKHFGNQLKIIDVKKFSTRTKEGEKGECEICLLRVV